MFRSLCLERGGAVRGVPRLQREARARAAQDRGECARACACACACASFELRGWGRHYQTART
eukprot:6196012-Pleurochrysis_carterae.AAC.1